MLGLGVVFFVRHPRLDHPDLWLSAWADHAVFVVRPCPRFLRRQRRPRISKSEYYSSSPWFRRLLATLNWRPVDDYELREIEFEQSDRVYEKRMIRLEREISQIETENARLAELNAKLSAISSSSGTNSSPTNRAPNESEI
jgi:hypothetical protein